MIFHFSKIKVFSLKNDGCLDLSHSSGWRHFEISKDQERNVIQIQRRPRRKSEERGKMFMVAYIIFAEAAGTNFYLPKSLLIKKNNQGSGSNSCRLLNSNEIIQLKWGNQRNYINKLTKNDP